MVESEYDEVVLEISKHGTIIAKENDEITKKGVFSGVDAVTGLLVLQPCSALWRRQNYGASDR